MTALNPFAKCNCDGSCVPPPHECKTAKRNEIGEPYWWGGFAVGLALCAGALLVAWMVTGVL